MKTRERPLHDFMAEVDERTDVRRGAPLPFGTDELEGGINFAFFSRDASRVRLELFSSATDATPTKAIDLDPAHHRTGDIWHVWVGGIGPGQLYAYRVDGPYSPKQGQRFNVHKLLLDPFATAITQLPHWDFSPARGDDPSAPGGETVPSTVDDAAAMLGDAAGEGVDPLHRAPGAVHGRRCRSDAEMRLHSRALPLARRPAAPTRVVEDGDL